MSNKSTGTKFEKEFAETLAKHWFWVHIFQDNRNGQPCDVIVARDGRTYLFDCKNCEENFFSLARIEENQYNAMELFKYTGNSNGMFAIRFPDTSIYLLDFEDAKRLEHRGCLSITKNVLKRYSTSLMDWLDSLNGDGKVGRINADPDWR